MNTPKPLLVLLLATAAATAGAQQLEFLPPEGAPSVQQESVKYTLLKPDDKTSETVKEGEHNPFVQSDAELRTQNEKGTNEENQIRERLEKLRVVGVSPGASGMRVMLGDMVLEPGQFVPQILAEQTLMLRVGNITPSAIELVWVEKKPSGLPARVMTIAVDLRPYVRYKLMGQPTEKNQWEKPKAEAGPVPVARLFPEVAQTPASAPVHVAQNTAVPRAIPVSDDGTQAGSDAPPPAEQQPTVKPNPQWEKALQLLDKLLPKEGAKP